MSITALPTPPTRSDPTSFASRADAFLSALPTFVTETNTTAASLTSAESNASASATAANNSKLDAQTAQTAAELAATNAQTAYDSFDDRYLGAKSSPPTVDNDGNTLLVGALYYKTTATEGMYVWNGTAWEQAYAPVAGYQPLLVNQTNIKSVNGTTLLGTGDLVVGNVTGAASSTSGNIVTMNGTTGKVIQDGGKALPSGSIVGTSDTQTLTAKTIEAGVFTKGYQETVVTANSTTAYTIDLTNGSIFDITLTGNCTFTFPTVVAGKSFMLFVSQDATGSRTITWPASASFSGGTAPSITTTASKTDKFVFTAVRTKWVLSEAGKNYTL